MFAHSTLPDPSLQKAAAAPSLALEFTKQFPQVSADNKLQYWIAGSLGVNLFCAATEATVLEAASLPTLMTSRLPALRDELSERLKPLLRGIGDVDLLRPFGTTVPSMFPSSEFQLNLRDFSFRALNALRESDAKTIKVESASSLVEGGPIVAEVKIGGGLYYVAHPFEVIVHVAKLSCIVNDVCDRPKHLAKFEKMLPLIDDLVGGKFLAQRAAIELRAFNDKHGSRFIPNHPEFRADTASAQRFFDTMAEFM